VLDIQDIEVLSLAVECVSTIASRSRSRGILLVQLGDYFIYKFTCLHIGLLYCIVLYCVVLYSFIPWLISYLFICLFTSFMYLHLKGFLEKIKAILEKYDDHKLIRNSLASLSALAKPFENKVSSSSLSFLPTLFLFLSPLMLN